MALRSRGLSHPRFVLEMALVPMAALFLFPVAWTSHYVAVLPAYMAAINARARVPRSCAGHRALTAGLGAAAGLLALAVTLATESFSPVFLGHFVLFCVPLAYALFGPMPKAREQPEAHFGLPVFRRVAGIHAAPGWVGSGSSRPTVLGPSLRY